MAEQAGEVADEGHAEVGVARGGHGGREPAAVLAHHGAPGLVDDLHLAQLGPQGVEGRGDLDAQARPRVAGQHVGGERVAAHERQWVVGTWARPPPPSAAAAAARS